MEINSKKYWDYVNILKEELLPAMGCTEPIAVAYAAAKCRDLLKEDITCSKLTVSGPIIKNTNSVVVPHTGGLKGLKASVAAGIVSGNADAVLEVLSNVKEEQYSEIADFIEQKPIEIVAAENGLPFYIEIEEFGVINSAKIVIEEYHTNIVLMELNGETVWEKPPGTELHFATDHTILNVTEIWDFTNKVNLSDIRELISKQIEYNKTISEEGLNNSWGAQIGRIETDKGDEDLRNRACAAAAAGIDARMSGCELPVVIISGSGNQGMTASLPVISYAESFGCTEERLYRALVLSSLLTIHQKTPIGRVSAFCGAVSAGVAAGCGIAYLDGCDLNAIKQILTNGLAISPGMVCDGAKPSCAAKAFVSVFSGIMGYNMYLSGKQFYPGDGILKTDVEKTIKTIGKMAKHGMKETDKKILELMLLKN